MVSHNIQILAFGELACFTSFLQAIFTAFFFTRVTSKVTCFFKSRTEFFVNFQESAGNTMTDCTCLAGYATADNIYEYIVFAFGFGEFKRLVYD